MSPRRKWPSCGKEFQARPSSNPSSNLLMAPQSCLKALCATIAAAAQLCFSSTKPMKPWLSARCNCLPPADRHPQANCPHLEEGTFRGWGGMGRRRAVSRRTPCRHKFRNACIQVISPAMRSFLLLLVAASVCSAQTATSVPKPPWAGEAKPAASKPDAGNEQQDPTIKVDVNLVFVFVAVTDGRGAPVSTLGRDNFQVFEDGHPQKVAVFAKESELPLSIVMAIDTSLSTRKDLPLELNSA